MSKDGIIEKLYRSSLHTFACYRPEQPIATKEPNQIQGHAREVHCNQPHLHKKKPHKYCSNYISTTKYNIITFLPKALMEQFVRVANMYFLVAALLSLTDLSPLAPESVISPLVFVVGVSMAKEAIEDWQRFVQDMKVNLRKALVHKSNGIFHQKPWMKIKVGHIVKVEKDQFFPADLLLLSSSYEDGICYVETMNLDGETNLKIKRSLDVTLPWNNDDSFKNFSANIRCEDPNPNLYSFLGNLKYDHLVIPLDPSQILLRDSKLRNTAYVYGVVVFTGSDSKVMQNSTKCPSKRSSVDKQLDKIIYLLFTLLFLISLISSMAYTMMTKYKFPNWWYIQAPAGDKTHNLDRPQLSGFNHLITALILYGYLIPISLYVSIEMVKFLQAIFINQDILMYDEESGTPANARTSNINEELGQVDTILSDKTGTLTCNQMDFLKCSIAGVAYGTCASDVELAAATEIASHLKLKDHDVVNTILNGALSPQDSYCGSESEIELEAVLTTRDGKSHGGDIKGFGFFDSRIMNGNWMKEPNADIILLYFRILAICHTAIPELNVETGTCSYEAESPDEGSFLVAAREFGFEFCKRSQSSIVVSERYPSYNDPVERKYKVLSLLDFTSKRKRMSIIIQDENDQIYLLSKGADSIIFDRLSKDGRMFEEATTKHLSDFGEAGLRTLALAYRKIDEKEYSAWNEEFTNAKTSLGAERETMLERVSDMIEKELILVGAAAVEDKLQKGVPQCIDTLAKAGLKIWVLTGDKMETAINIGFACSLLRQGMKQICLTTRSEKSVDDTKTAIKDDLLKQINSASQMVKREEGSYAAFALIIDGKALAYALDNDMKFHFLNLAVTCASVICCRVSPRQKAQVTSLVKEGTGKITLAIGDGANDVGMIQEADIGVGISGAEGMQAVMASDFSIAQFRFLERLLIVHGHWCYKRITQMICYFIYKNLVFGLTLFYFEAYAGFSGQAIYDDWYMIIFNVAVTSLPAIALGVLEQDVSSDVCLQFPALYHQGPQNLYFNSTRIFGWMGNALYTSVVIFFPNVYIFNDQAFRFEGQTADLANLGTIMFTCIVWVVNYQMALKMTYLTFLQHILIWGSIILWYIFLIVYGIWPSYSTGTYSEFVEALAPTPSYWAATLLVTFACTFPYLAIISLQRVFYPMDHHIIQEIKYCGKHIKDKRMWKREKWKAKRHTKIGFTARVDAKIRQLQGKLQKSYSNIIRHSHSHS